MNKSIRRLAATLFVLLGSSPVVHAALQERGSGLLYDDVLNVTWLQDANYAKTSGVDADGMMTWEAAASWLTGLNYYDATRDQYLTGWRLPTVKPISGKSFNYEWQWDGTSDEGYNIISPNSEMGWMYYVNLGLLGWYLPDGTHPRSFGVMGSYTAIWSGQRDVGLAKNVQSNAYWSMTGGTDYSDMQAWTFTTAEGVQRDGFPRPNRLYVWAVRDGDVIAQSVPEPGTWLTLAVGLSVIGGCVARRRRSEPMSDHPGSTER